MFKRFSLVTLFAFLVNLLPFSAGAFTLVEYIDYNLSADSVVFYESSIYTPSSTTVVKLPKSTGSILYVGSDYRFEGMDLSIPVFTEAASGSAVVEYMSEDDGVWTQLTTVSNLKSPSPGVPLQLSWEDPGNDWTQNALRDYDSAASIFGTAYYYVRIRVTSDYSAQAVTSDFGLVDYNVDVQVTDELGDPIDLDSVSDLGLLAQRTYDDTIYASDEVSTGSYRLALKADPDNEREYTLAPKGFVAPGTYYDADPDGSTWEADDLKYAHKFSATDPTGADMPMAGTNRSECEVAGESAYCAVHYDEDTSESVVLYAEGYAPETVSFTNRSTAASAQATYTPEFDYGHLIYLTNSSTGSAISTATIKAGTSYGVTCVHLGSGTYGCPMPLNESKVKITATGYQDLESTVAPRTSNAAAQVTTSLSLTLGSSPSPTPSPTPSTDSSALKVSSIYVDSGDDLRFTVKNEGDRDVDGDVTLTVYVDGDLEWEKDFDEDYFQEGESSKFNAGELLKDEDTYEVKVCTDSKGDDDCETEKIKVQDLADDEDSSRSCDHDFKDIDDSFAEKAICILVEEGVIKQKDYYYPNKHINRAEFLKIALLNAGYDVRAVDNVFYKDMSEDDWYYSYVTYATEKGFIKGYSDGTFRASDPINRAEAVVMLMRIAGEELWDYGASDIDFYDVEVSDWYAYAVILASQNGIVEGYSDNAFRPHADLTRAETAVIARRMWYVYYN